MLTNADLEDKFLIFISKQFIEFNDQNAKAYSQFIELLGKPKSKMEYIDDLPCHIGWHQDRYIDYNTSEVLELIYPLVEELKSLFQQNNSSVERRIYLRNDIPEIDADILANIQRYDLINSLSDADGVEFNIYLSTMEEWLIEQWQCIGKLGDFYRKVASRFNVSYEEILSSGERDQCVLICFLEHLKKIGHDANFDLYSEAVLHIDGDIIDNEDELMKIGSIN